MAEPLTKVGATNYNAKAMYIIEKILRHDKHHSKSIQVQPKYIQTVMCASSANFLDKTITLGTASA